MLVLSDSWNQLENMDIAIESVQVEVNASCASVRRARTLMPYALKLSVPKLSAPNNGDVKDSWSLLPREEGCKVSGKEDGGGGVDVASRDGRVVTLLGGGNASAFCDQNVSLIDTEGKSPSRLIDTKNLFLKLSDHLEVQIGTSGSLCTNSTCESECPPRDFLDTYVRISLRSVYHS